MGDVRYKGYEDPAYSVERRDGAFEVRRYAPQVAAEVTVPVDPGWHPSP